MTAIAVPVSKETKEEKAPEMTFPYSKSVKVWIRRKPFSGALPGQNPDDARVKIGAGFRNQDTLRGLTSIEEGKLLPSIIGVSPTDGASWLKATKDYWSEISREVPPQNGLELETGMTWFSKEDYEADKIAKRDTKNGNKYECKGIPINIADYILWRYCLVYSRCANKQEDLYLSPKIEMYIYSKEEEIQLKKATYATEKRSMQLLYQKIGDRMWSDYLLSILIASDKDSKVAVKDLPAIDEDEKDILLTGYAKSNPTRFYKFGTDKDLELKGFIESCISLGLLVRIPNTETVCHNDIPIGSTIDEAVTFLKSDKNTKVVDSLKAQIKQVTT